MLFNPDNAVMSFFTSDIAPLKNGNLGGNDVSGALKRVYYAENGDYTFARQIWNYLVGEMNVIFA